MKLCKSGITMISVLTVSMSRKHVVENSLSLCVHKCCHEMTLKTLVDMQQFLIFYLSLMNMKRLTYDGKGWNREDEPTIS